MLLQVANNPDKAEVVAAEADRLDEMAQKAQAQAGQQGVSGARTLLHQPSEAQVIASETTGVVSISAAPQTLGQITYASQAACRVLGYSRAQLEHRNVSAIVPSPMAEAQ
jgi:PAS domain-containing protein